MTGALNDDIVLEVDNLTGHFEGQSSSTLRGVTFSVRKGGLTAIVGETGSGKSLTALSALRIAPRNFVVDSGVIRFCGVDLLSMDNAEIKSMRGAGIAMVFQDARTALNPLMTVGTQLSQVCRLHRKVSKREADLIVCEALERVGIKEPRRRSKQYPHEFSGGMAQRVMIAMALICQPELVILDEPTTGLDVTIQAGIIDLILELVDGGMTGCLITHDLGVVAEACDEVIVMRHGQVLEGGSTRDVFERPIHEYTQLLIRASEEMSEGSKP
ncbi:ABC transporter ATP-binding protein [Microbacterium sp. 18062]|uniref:ABC transporter ATP-binding protein n=1 Tax=Microbacterium sp. 18062 TaxID=2681410 RepID=UPI00135CA357|nr:ABC transporter ATP-binding protein [Microbacterium sp. 18062]